MPQKNRPRPIPSYDDSYMRIEGPTMQPFRYPKPERWFDGIKHNNWQDPDPPITEMELISMLAVVPPPSEPNKLIISRKTVTKIKKIIGRHDKLDAKPTINRPSRHERNSN